MGDLASIFKAYDIRGVVPDQLDEGVAEALDAGSVELDVVLGPAGGEVLASGGELADQLGEDAVVR